jgi:IstB-like ATP binding protein
MTATDLTTPTSHPAPAPAPAVTVTGPATPAQASLYQQLRGHLATLKLHDAAEHLPTVLDRATAEGLSLTAALERLLGHEVTASEARRLTGRLRFACLPTPATLEDFDYDAAPGLDPTLINELATCRYLESATNLLLIGPPGVGKTHVAVGLARKAAESGAAGRPRFRAGPVAVMASSSTLGQPKSTPVRVWLTWPSQVSP